ncbi:MAG: hypothetical protein AAF317_18405, partial [Pseudomonadota bacterium]
MNALFAEFRNITVVVGLGAYAMQAFGQADLVGAPSDCIAQKSVCAGTSEPQNILFFGNSYTGVFLGQRSVPDLVRDIAEAAGRTGVYTKGATSNGRDFAWHIAANTGVISSDLPAGAFWDRVVMQNFS